MIEHIEKLCNEHTELNEKQIQILVGMAPLLQAIANLEHSDIFIDCTTTDGDPIVVAQANPEGVASNYKNSVVGMLAKKENEPAVARSLMLGMATKHMKGLTQENVVVIQSVEPIISENYIIGVLIKEKQIELWKKEDAVAKINGQHLKELIDGTIGNMWLADQIDEAVLMVDNSGIVIFANELANKLFLKLGYMQGIVGSSYENISLVKGEIITLGDQKFYDDVETQVGQYHLGVKKIKINHSTGGFAVLIRDITNMKEQEKEIILKSVAIKEMHHRIKNNLQTIASLLRLQMRRSNSEDTKEVLLESMNRILAIVATHELLARSGVDEVLIQEVISHIKNNIVRYYSNGNFTVDIGIYGGEFTVSSDIATSVALVVNELVHNSLKHGFADRSKGKIDIEITQGSLYCEVRILDDGIGYNESEQNNNGLGMQIVQALVKDKLKGNLSIYSGDDGTQVVFNFRQSNIAM